MMDRSVSVCVSIKLLNEADKKLLERPFHQQQLKFRFTKSQRQSGGILPYFAVSISLWESQHKGNQQQSVSVLLLRENKVDLSIEMFLLHKVRRIT